MLTSGRIIATISGTWTHVAGTEDETVGWHYQLDGHEFEQALGVGDGQGSLACCSPWGQKELDMTEQLNWTDFGEGVDISRIWATTHSLFLTIPGNCHGTSGCVISLADQGSRSTLPSWSHSWFILCPWAMSFFQKLCPTPFPPFTRILDWVAISFSRGSSWTRDRTQVSCIAGWFFPVWATRVSLRATITDQKVDGGPIPGNLCLFSEIVGIILHLLAYEIIQPIKTNHGTSLVVQWLRLWAPNGGGMGSIPG